MMQLTRSRPESLWIFLCLCASIAYHISSWEKGENTSPFPGSDMPKNRHVHDHEHVNSASQYSPGWLQTETAEKRRPHFVLPFWLNSEVDTCDRTIFPRDMGPGVTSTPVARQGIGRQSGCGTATRRVHNVSRCIIVASTLLRA